MRLTTVQVFAILAVLTAVPFQLSGGEPDERPACTAKTRSQFWPQAANTNPAAARAAAQAGELRICTRQGFRYSWRELTVHWTSLRKKGAEPTATEKPVALLTDHDGKSADHSAQLGGLTFENSPDAKHKAGLSARNRPASGKLSEVPGVRR
ncbi:MAG: hypothetical protein SGI92_18940 [Bryobacteraceae bacterium]|nr:hypothetical protein [Bryobacteraceae bacterium]